MSSLSRVGVDSASALTRYWADVDNKFLFHLQSSTGEKVSFSNWSNYQSEYLSQLSIIQELIDNGLAISSNSSVEIETEND